MSTIIITEKTRLKTTGEKLEVYQDFAAFANKNGYLISTDISSNEYFLIKKETPVQTTQDLIDALEASITPRRLREAALGVRASIDFIANVDTQITALREKL